MRVTAARIRSAFNKDFYGRNITSKMWNPNVSTLLASSSLWACVMRKKMPYISSFLRQQMALTIRRPWQFRLMLCTVSDTCSQWGVFCNSYDWRTPLPTNTNVELYLEGIDRKPWLPEGISLEPRCLHKNLLSSSENNWRDLFFQALHDTWGFQVSVTTSNPDNQSLGCVSRTNATKQRQLHLTCIKGNTITCTDQHLYLVITHCIGDYAWGAVILAVLKTGNDNAVNTDVVVVIVKRSHLSQAPLTKNTCGIQKCSHTVIYELNFSNGK